MKILYFGVFIRPYDTETYIANTLEKLGHVVDRKNINEIGAHELRDLMFRDYDFVLVSKGWFVEKDMEECERIFKSSPLLKVSWFFDITWGTGREQIMLAHPTFWCDIMLTTDGGHDDKWKEYGLNHKCLRQGIYEPEAYIAEDDPEEKRDIVFVGTNVHESWFGWSHRTKLLNWLHKVYPDQFIWLGKKDGIRNDKLNRVLSNAKIVIGDSVYSPDYWSNRLYETLGRGGFLIFPMVPGIEKEFTPYEHFIPYHIGDWLGLKEKIDYFLTHKEEREKIRKAGFEHCKANHTYTHRCRKLVEIVNDYKNEHRIEKSRLLRKEAKEQGIL